MRMAGNLLALLLPLVLMFTCCSDPSGPSHGEEYPADADDGGIVEDAHDGDDAGDDAGTIEDDGGTVEDDGGTVEDDGDEETDSGDDGGSVQEDGDAGGESGDEGQPPSWTGLGPFEGNNVSWLHFSRADRNTLFVTQEGIEGTGYGIHMTSDGWRWNDLGILQEIHAYSISSDPADAQRLFVAAKYKLLRSLDGGRTWELLGAPEVPGDDTQFVIDRTRFYSVVISGSDPDRIYAGGRPVMVPDHLGVFARSLDGGDTWKILDTQKVVLRIVVDELDAENLLVMSFFGLHRSVDGGKTLQAVFVPDPDVTLRDIAVCPDLPDEGLLATSVDLHCTHDGGASWEPLPLGVEGLEPLSVAIHCDETGIQYALGTLSGRFFWDSSGGGAFEEVSTGLRPDSPITAIQFHPETAQLFAGSLVGGVYRLEQSQWSRIGMPIVSPTSVAFDPYNPGGLWVSAVFGVNQIFESDNRGDRFDPVMGMPDTQKVSCLVFDTVSPNVVWASIYDRYDGGVYRSDDRGQTWERVYGFVEDIIDRGTAINVIKFDPTNDDTILAAGNKALARSVDHGVTWDDITGMFADTQIMDFLVSADGSTYVAAVSGAELDSGVYLSEDLGATFNPAVGVPPTRCSAIMQTKQGRYLAGCEDGIFISPNQAGEEWVATGLTVGPVRGLSGTRGDPERIFAGVFRHGVFLSEDGGISWQGYGADLEDKRVISLAVDPSDEYLYAGCMYHSLTRTPVFP